MDVCYMFCNQSVQIMPYNTTIILLKSVHDNEPIVSQYPIYRCFSHATTFIQISVHTAHPGEGATAPPAL